MKTTFIIGAGASKEVNLPTGDELKAKIAELLDIRFDFNQRVSGDNTIEQALRIWVSKNPNPGEDKSINPYLKEAWHIRDSLPLAISIDNFVDSQRGNEKLSVCAKMAIIVSILEAERESKLYFDQYNGENTIDSSSIQDTWYRPLFQILTENCTFSDLPERLKSVSFIIFNYDRCIEHFLFHAMRDYYRISDKDAADLINQIEIFHPYGSIGSLPFTGNESPISFGQEILANQLVDSIARIRTFTEGMNHESSNPDTIGDSVHSCSKSIFLGYAYHKLNMELLKESKLSEGNKCCMKKKCFGSAYEVSSPDRLFIESQINNLFHYGQNEVLLSNATCFGLFKEFGRSLSF